LKSDPLTSNVFSVLAVTWSNCTKFQRSRTIRSGVVKVRGGVGQVSELTTSPALCVDV